MLPMQVFSNLKIMPGKFWTDILVPSEISVSKY